MRYFSGMFVALYVRPLVPEGMARAPERLALTEATSNAAAFPGDGAGTPVSGFCCADVSIPTPTIVMTAARRRLRLLRRPAVPGPRVTRDSTPRFVPVAPI